MLHRKLRWLLTISYYHLLIYGMMPTVLYIGHGQVTIKKMSAGYLIYSVCVTGMLLLEITQLMPSGIFNGYMRDNIVLQWTHFVGIGLRGAAVLSCHGLVWLQRRRLIQLYTDFLMHWRSHWQVLRRLAGDEALQRMQMELAAILLRNFCVSYGMFCCSLLMQYKLSKSHLLELMIRISLMLLLSVARIGFFTLLVLVSHQFKAVKLAVQALQSRVGFRSIEDIRRIAAIHFKWMELARRAFSIYDLPNAVVLLNMFTFNVNILYHAVQFSSKTIKSDDMGYIIGDGLIIFNFWNTILWMNMLDYALNSSNDIGHLMRQFNDLRRMSPESQMELDLFMSYLRSNRLVYRVCGCLVLDKPACLRYITSVFANVIILMQFDLRGRQENKT